MSEKAMQVEARSDSQIVTDQVADLEQRTGKKQLAPNKGMAWVVLVMTLLAGIVVIGNSSKINMSMAMLLDFFGKDTVWGGSLGSIFALVNAILVIPMGALCARYDVKKIICLSMVLCFVGSMVGAFASSSGVFLLGRVVEAVAYTGVYCTGAVLICKWFTPDRRSVPMGLWNAVVGMAGMVIGQASNILLPAFGFKGVWVYEAVAGIVMAVLFFVIVKEKPAVSSEPNKKIEAKEKAKISAGLMFPIFWAACIINGFSGLGIKGILTFSSLIFTDVAGVDGATTGNLFSLLSMGMMVAPIIGGFVYRLVGKHRGITLVVLFAVSMLVELSIFLCVHDEVTAWVCTALCGLFGMMFMPGLYTLVADHSPSPELNGIGVTIMMFGQFVCGVAGPTILGVVKASTGSWDGVVTLMVVMLVIGLAACVYLAVKDKKLWAERLASEREVSE